MNRFICSISIALAAASAAAGPPETPRRSALPQQHPYQVVLRDYLAGFAERDFEVPLAPLSVRGSTLRNEDDLYRLWILTRSFPATMGLLLPARAFTLRDIEAADGVRMSLAVRAPHPDGEAAADAVDTLWWATWDFSGNPYRGSAAVRNRAVAMAIVDMLMLDALQEQGTHWVDNVHRSDYLGGCLSRMAYVYRHAREHMPPAVSAAYEKGLGKFVARLCEWGPTGVNNNMDTHALVAAAYLEAGLGRESSLANAARGYCQQVLKEFHPAGMIRDAGGLEASYNGIALYNLAWACSVTPWPELRVMLNKTSRLKALLTFPEPDGRVFWGPSHFNTRTSADSAADQWAFPPRDLAIAMRAPDAAYLLFSGRTARPPNWAAPSPREMETAISEAVQRLNAIAWRPNPGRFAVWRASWWATGDFNFAFEHYLPGFYAHVRRLASGADPAALPPMAARGEPSVTVFPEPDTPCAADEDNTFLVARYPDFSAVVYTGPLGKHPYMNFGGGALSAFWTPTAGCAVLGRTGKPVQPAESRQTWGDWRVWPAHALSGETATGGVFSSARLDRANATVRYEPRPGGYLVRYGGRLQIQPGTGQAGPTPEDALPLFTRTIGIGPRGVAVNSALQFDGPEPITTVHELLPLALFDDRLQPAPAGRDTRFHVAFETPGGVMDGSRDGSPDVTSVIVRRWNGAVRIAFDRPQRVRLGEQWQDTYMTRIRVVNLIIDLPTASLDAEKGHRWSVQYRLSPEADPTPR